MSELTSILTIHPSAMDHLIFEGNLYPGPAVGGTIRVFAPVVVISHEEYERLVRDAGPSHE